MKIITRAEAKASGLTHYYPGSTCKNGHIDQRRTDNGQCMQCRHDAYWLNREAYLESCRERYSKDADRIKARVRKYRKANTEKDNTYRRRKYKNDPAFRVKHKMYDILWRSLNASGSSKTHRTNEMLGYTPDALKSHIEKQFSKGMDWENHGEWHLDHITPIKWFTDNGVIDPAIINCLSNLRPVWAKENLEKADARTHLI